MSIQQLHLCFTDSLGTKYAVFEIGVKKFGTFRKKKWFFFHRSMKATSKDTTLLLHHIKAIGNKAGE